ncbi:hypothetical protein [Streptomyces sp. NPDC001315]|uniref:hypothetical protein n=1 Tax=Streptomyces sp. NPDC001315 TaxID=3364562 RepID=UPI0036CF93AE
MPLTHLATHGGAAHTVLMAAMAVLGEGCALAALWSARSRTSVRCWLPHLVMGVVMAVACLPGTSAVVPWTGAAVLAASAVWSGWPVSGPVTARPTAGQSGARWYTCADLVACAVLLALTASPAAAGEAGHTGPPAPVAAVTVAVTLAWAGARTALFAGVLPPRAAGRAGLGTRLARLGSPVMVPLMGVMVLTA